MKAQRRGKIVNISSMTVPTASPDFLHYVSSKSAIVGLTRALARELGEWNVCVNTISPDYIAFDRDYDNRQPEMAADARAAAVLQARAALPRTWSARSSTSLGHGSDFVTGQNLYVNGGRIFT